MLSRNKTEMCLLSWHHAHFNPLVTRYELILTPGELNRGRGEESQLTNQRIAFRTPIPSSLPSPLGSYKHLKTINYRRRWKNGKKIEKLETKTKQLSRGLAGILDRDCPDEQKRAEQGFGV